MFLKQKTFQPYSWSFKIFPLPPLLPQFPLICLFCHCMHRAASLAVLHLHCWLPEGQIPSGVTSCAVLSLRPWDILGEMKNPLVTVVTSSLLSCSLPLSLSPAVFWWGSCLRWMYQKQQVITMTHWAQISCWGAVVWWWHLPWMRYLRDSSVSVILKYDAICIILVSSFSHAQQG